MTAFEAEVRSAWMGQVPLDALITEMMDERRAPAWQWDDYRQRISAIYRKLDSEYGVTT
jgi:hypothetical protein